MVQNFSISKKKWEEYYEKMPHWAVSSSSSKLAIYFIRFLEKKRIKKGELLEIGCGNGRDAVFFARCGFNVSGVDIASNSIILCEKNKINFIKKRTIEDFEIKLVQNIKFLTGDAEKLPFQNNSFIGVYSIGVLHNTNLKKSLNELARVIKKNGLAVIHLYEKTIFLSSEKTEKHYSSKKIKNILAGLPFRILKFKSNIVKEEPDYDKKIGAHKHFAVILYLEKI